MRKTELKTWVAMSVFLLAVVSTAAGQTITVDDDGPADFNNIQAAINDSNHGDIIVVSPGIYTGSGNRDIDFHGKAITVRSENGPESCVIDCNGTYNEPHRGFYFHSGEDCNSVVVGFTITNGYANSGGGIRCSGSSPMLTDCTFSENSADDGGGIHNSDSSPTIVNCTFTENMAYDDGGGIYCDNASLPTIIGCMVTGNTASENGGGIYCRDVDSGTVEKNIIVGNSAQNNGGGIYCNQSSPKITNNTIMINRAGDGAGIHCGADASPTIKNNTIIKNTADSDGGAIACHLSSSPMIMNNTMMSNAADNGGGICCRPLSSPTVTNCILWGNTAGEGPELALYADYSHINGCVVTASYNNVQGGESAVYVEQGCTLNWSPANIDLEPLLTTDGHIQADSPCIDAGDPNHNPAPEETDIDGEPRIYGGCVDIGSDEFIDIDGDGLPDWWEQEYFGEHTAGNPDDDCDEDGLDNLAEYHLSRDPMVPPLNYYVDAVNGSDEWDGLSELWDGTHGPKSSIQAAIDAALRYEGDTIIIAAGTYTGTGNRDIDFKGKVITVRSTDPADPCVVAATVIDCQGSYEDLHRGFEFHLREGSDSVVAGLTITNGWYPDGGGIYCRDSSPTITGNTVTQNAYNGIYCRNSSAIITDNTVTQNNNGGIYCLDSSPTIAGNTITQNNNRGVFCEDCLLATITNNTIRQNTAPDGGGICCRDSSAMIANNTVVDNLAEDDGGGIYCRRCSQITILNNIITGNMSHDNAGGIYCRDSEGNITGNIIVGNTTEDGGGLWCRGSSLTITNNTISGNAAEEDGGGVCCRWTSSLVMTNTILWGNTADNGPEMAVKDDSTLTVTYSNVAGGQGEAYIEPDSVLVYGPNNFDEDPCFIEPGYWADVSDPNIVVEPDDPNAVWVDGDYHLLGVSPCINAGDPNYVAEPNETDLDGRPRIIGGRIDMGAYEFNHIPVADAGPNQTAYAWINGIAEVTLDGTGSFDDDGHLLTYLWSWTIDGQTYDANGVTPTIELPVGEQTIELIVNDGIDYSEPNQVVITVIEPIQSQLWVFPQIINRYGRQPKIFALLRLPEGITRDQIDSDEPLLLYPGGIEAIRQYVTQSRRRRTEQVSILAFFDKGELMNAVPDDGSVELQVVGWLKTGRYFYGSDSVRIIGRRRMPRRSFRGRNASSVVLGR